MLVANLQTLPLGTIVAPSATLPPAPAHASIPVANSNGNGSAAPREPSPVRMLTSATSTTKPVAVAQQMLAAHAAHSTSEAEGMAPGAPSNGSAASLNSKFPMMQYHLSLDASRALPADLKAANSELVGLQERGMDQQADDMDDKNVMENGESQATPAAATGEPSAKRVRPEQVAETAVPEPPLSDQEAASLLHHVETIIRQRSVTRLEQVSRRA